MPTERLYYGCNADGCSCYEFGASVCLCDCYSCRGARKAEVKATELFQPLTGANAKAHESIMNLTPEEIGKIAVDAGIYTEDGKLTEHYAPKKRDDK